METAVELFQRLMKENNLEVTLNRPAVRFIENGGVVVEQPQLMVAYAPQNESLPEPEVETPAPENKEVDPNVAEEPKEVNTQSVGDEPV